MEGLRDLVESCWGSRLPHPSEASGSDLNWASVGPDRRHPGPAWPLAHGGHKRARNLRKRCPTGLGPTLGRGLRPGLRKAFPEATCRLPLWRARAGPQPPNHHPGPPAVHQQLHRAAEPHAAGGGPLGGRARGGCPGHPPLAPGAHSQALPSPGQRRPNVRSAATVRAPAGFHRQPPRDRGTPHPSSLRSPFCPGEWVRPHGGESCMGWVRFAMRWGRSSPSCGRLWGRVMDGGRGLDGEFGTHTVWGVGCG